MKQLIFRKLINSLTNKKQLWPAVLLLAVLGLSLPFYNAYAVWAVLASSITFLYIQAGLQFFLFVSNIILGIVIALLALVTGPFINVSFTTNEFVTQGWTLTKDLVNIGFIILLAVIGLGTALRIKEYEWQKTLPRLLLIMLLVNFTPVICGVIIDAANIMMNYFLNGISGWNAFKNTMDAQFRMLSTALTTFGGIFELFIGTFLLKTVATIGICWMGIFVYILFIILFLTRYVMLWTLVIVSPIAFFTYVFKESGIVKKLFPGILHWEEWWDQFLQWSIVGITMSFFLYLSNNLLGFMNTGSMPVGKLPPGASGGGWIDTLVPYIVSLVLLIVGFLTSIKTSPMGAGMAIGFAKEHVPKLAKQTFIKTLDATKSAKNWAGETGRKILGPERIDRLEKSNIGKWTRKIQEATPAMPVIKAPEKGGLRDLIFPYSEVETPGKTDLARRAKIKKAKATNKELLLYGHDDEVKAAARRPSVPWSDNTDKIGAIKALEESRPELAVEFTGKPIEIFITESTPKEIKDNILPKSLRNIDVVMAMLKDPRIFEEIGKRGRKEQIEAIKEGIKNGTATISEKVTNLMKENKLDEAENITKTIDSIMSSPNYFGKKPSETKESKTEKKEDKEDPMFG